MTEVHVPFTEQQSQKLTLVQTSFGVFQNFTATKTRR